MGRGCWHVALFAALAALSVAAPLDSFMISFWVDPVVLPEEFAAQYATIASAGFTHILGGFGATTPETVAAQLTAAAGLGLRVLPSACETAAGPGPSGSCVGLTGTALAGFQMADEPSATDFPAVAVWASSVAARAPSALRFINLLPNYASVGALGAPSYAAYLNSFVDAVHPDLLSFDHYPAFYPGSAVDNGSNVSMAGYIRNLEAVRAAAIDAGIAFVNFFAAMPFNGRPDVSEGQMRWQIWTSVAHGAKGVLYFCYWSPAGDSFAWGGALMYPRVPVVGGPAVYGTGEHYAQAQRINVRLAAIGKRLFRANTTAVASANGTAAGTITAGDAGAGQIAQFGGSGSGSTWSLLLGAFILPRDDASFNFTAAVLVVNQDPDNPVLATLIFAAGARPVFEVSPTGSAFPALDDAPAIQDYQASLQAGDARLFVF